MNTAPANRECASCYDAQAFVLLLDGPRCPRLRPRETSRRPARSDPSPRTPPRRVIERRLCFVFLLL